MCLKGMMKEIAPGFPAVPIERNRDVKIWGRRWMIWTLSTSGASQVEIAEALGLDRETVAKDIGAVRDLLKFAPETVEQVIRETYARMVDARNTVVARAQESKTDKDAAKLWAVVAEFDMKILERFTQPIGRGKTDVHIDQTGKLAIDYIASTYGADGLQHFLDWCEKQGVRQIPVEEPKAEQKGRNK